MRNNEINSKMLFIRNNTAKDRYSDRQYLKNTLGGMASRYQKEYQLIIYAVNIGISDMILSGRNSEKELEHYALRLGASAAVSNESARDTVEYLNLLLTGRNTVIGKAIQNSPSEGNKIQNSQHEAGKRVQNPQPVEGTKYNQPIEEKDDKDIRKRIYIALAICLVLIAALVVIILLPSKSADSSDNGRTEDSSYSDTSDVTEENADPDSTNSQTDYKKALSASGYYGSTSGLSQVYFSRSSASSQIYCNGVFYSSDCAIDNDISTNWQEDATGDGIGEYLVLMFDTEREIKYISVLPGYASDKDAYYRNNRPKEIKIEFSDGRCVTYTLSDSMDYNTIELSEPVDTSYVKIYIQSVYAGSEWDDTVIAEVKAYR